MSARRRAATAAAAALLLAGAAPEAARAVDVSATELRELAGRAADDAGARSRLGEVDRVDGRPVDVGAIVEDARPEDVEARVELALESAGASGERAGEAGGARERAREVLDDRRFTGTDVPRPFTGALRWLGRRLEPVWTFVDDLIDSIPGGRPVGWALVGALVLALGAGFARVAIRRGAGRSGAGGRDGRRRRPEDPAALERAADAAERAGDWEAAVRLRFRAGLLRLDSREVIAYRPSLTTGEVARALGSPDFDRLGRDFDAIAYGGRPAGAAEAETAREGWRAVLAAAGTEKGP